MEQIVWVETPPCRLCRAPAAFKRRMPCRGCTKLLENENAAPSKGRRKKGTANTRWREERDRRIIKLRAQGLSFTCIAAALNMPRATVQSAAAAALKRGAAGA